MRIIEVAGGEERSLCRRLRRATPSKMRTVLSSTLALLVFCSLALSSKEVEICPHENCLAPEKCESLVRGEVRCLEQGTKCCSIVKKEFQTHCRHFGGACMDKCAETLQRSAVDCRNDQMCCVLV